MKLIMKSDMNVSYGNEQNYIVNFVYPVGHVRAGKLQEQAHEIAG